MVEKEMRLGGDCRGINGLVALLAMIGKVGFGSLLSGYCSQQ